MAKIYLVRHTKVNVPKGICYGASDVPLAATFLEEVQKIREQLEGITFDHIYSSPLQRCKQLANLLANNHYTIDTNLSELNFGEWEGKYWDDIYQTPYGKEWMNNYLHLSCPGGESYNDLYNRTTLFLNNLNTNKNSLIITHAGIIRVCLNILNNIDIESTFNSEIKYGEIVVINVTKNFQEGYSAF